MVKFKFFKKNNNNNNSNSEPNLSLELYKNENDGTNQCQQQYQNHQLQQNHQDQLQPNHQLQQHHQDHQQQNYQLKKTVNFSDSLSTDIDNKIQYPTTPNRKSLTKRYDHPNTPPDQYYDKTQLEKPKQLKKSKSIVFDIPPKTTKRVKCFNYNYYHHYYYYLILIIVIIIIISIFIFKNL